MKRMNFLGPAAVFLMTLWPGVVHAQTEDYPICIAKNQSYTRTDRHLDYVSLESPADGRQQTDIAAPRMPYTSLMDRTFKAKAGETVTAAFGFSTNWMNGYVYIDWNRDGQFQYEAASYPAEGTELMAYSHYKGVNSKGAGTDGSVVNPPAFTLPVSVSNGRYCMRYKVDWDCVDPAGNTSENNSLLTNGGAFADICLEVHGDVTQVEVLSAHGTVLADGEGVSFALWPYGCARTLQIQPDEGYVVDGVRLRYGCGLDGERLVHGVPQYTEEVVPAYLLPDNSVTIPAEKMNNEVRLEVIYVAQIGNKSREKDYALNFDKSLTTSSDAETAVRKLTVEAAVGGKTELAVGAQTVYECLSRPAVSALPGDRLTLNLSTDRRKLHAYLYVDYNQDGTFANSLNEDGTPTVSGELVSYTYYDGHNSLGEAVKADDAAALSARMPAFDLPQQLPAGVYRARLKTDYADIDPAGQWGEDEAQHIDRNGGQVIDFFINVHHAKHGLELNTLNGNVYSSTNEALPVEVSCYSPIAAQAVPFADGYVADSVYVRHGHGLDGPQFVHGNRQWYEYRQSIKSKKTFTIPKDSVDGDILITVHFLPDGSETMDLVFSDEFNTPDGTLPDSEKWVCCPRQNAAWNRFVVNSPEVAFIRDGKFVARAIPDPDNAQQMQTGGMQTRGKFSFMYGKVECRARTNGHKGNFPAIWMMPDDQKEGWPSCGEIDIFETINTENTAYHTVHSNWTYNLGQTNNPRSSYSEAAPMDRYHTYGFEWSPTQMKWYVDGKQVATYTKSTDQNALDKGQWPFDRRFYLILNQSVGNGSWAAAPDFTHIYETTFDWIRVYQPKSITDVSATSSDASALKMRPAEGGIAVSTTRNMPVMVFDLAGRLVCRTEVNGSAHIPLTGGIYMVNGQKIFVN